MSRRNLFIIAFLALIAILLFWVWPWSEEYDLGTLQPTNDTSITSFCVYEITKTDCEHPAPFYKIGEIICIECCVNGANPWPPNVRGVSNCHKKIVFTSQDGTCEYYAKRTSESCMNCPAESKQKYKCPNP